jgi:iron complex transport system ATP-binding protein
MRPLESLRPTPATIPLLDLHHVTVMRGMREGLRDVTLCIAQGEHVCILGPNGSGKSTLIKTLTRECYPVFDPQSSIRILGRDRWDVFELRSTLGIVCADQFPETVTSTTAIEIVVSSFFSATRIFSHHEVTPDLISRGHEALERAGVAHLADRPFCEMSAGEARRTLVARALIHNPQTLLLDEPSTSLDLHAQMQLRQTLRDLAQSGVGIVLVTHHVSEIIPEVERIVILAEGRVQADGPKAALLTPERLSALFATQVRLSHHDGYLYAY